MAALIERKFKPVIGMSLTQVRNVGGIWMFSFGPLVRVPGKRVWRSTWTVHGYCPWRLLHRNRIVVGCDDQWNPPNMGSRSCSLPLPESWSKSLGHRIVTDLLGTPESLAEGNTTNAGRFQLVRVSSDRFGGLRLHLSGGFIVELITVASRGQQWRLMAGDDAKCDILVGSGEVLAAPESPEPGS